VFVIDDIIEEVKPKSSASSRRPSGHHQTWEQAAGDSPVVKLVNYCIYNAVKDGASDIHIEPGDAQLRIRYRVDGRLMEKLRPPHQMPRGRIARKDHGGLDISERRLPQDGGIHVMMDKRPIDLRVSTMPGKHGEKVVIRVIDNDKASVNLEKLGFGYETLKAWRKLISLPNGICSSPARPVPARAPRSTPACRSSMPTTRTSARSRIPSNTRLAGSISSR
jgi:type IV pilus assembly protein PilB